MMLRISFLTFALIAIGGLNAAFSQNSVLESGNWIKLEVKESAMYKLSYSDLLAYGLDPNAIDPKTIRIFGNGGGMLPQANSIERPKDLIELAINVSGAEDGTFNQDDYVLFYGVGSDFIEFDSLSKVFNYQNHLFTNSNFYFLNVNQKNGKRVKSGTPQTGGQSISAAYKVFIHEEELSNILHSGREWFGEKFDLETNLNFQTNLNNIASNSEVKLVSSVMSSSLQDANFKVQINGVEVGNQPIPANPDGTYSTKGTRRLDIFSIGANALNTNSLEVAYTFEKEFGVGYLDYFLVQSLVNLKYENTPLKINIGDLNDQGNITLSITEAPANLVLWNISDHNQATSEQYTLSGSTLSFNTSSTATKYMLFDPLTLTNTVTSAEELENQNLHSTSATDLLIVSPNIFASQANSIAELRSSEGLNVKVVTPTQIYNEFSSGKPDITAIRDYAKLLFDEAGLKYLFIVGKGTYDPKDIVASGLQVIPIYESRNSLQPLATYGSDDYLGFLEDSEGDWSESPTVDHTLDIGVGRIPVTTTLEADNYVNKLIKYANKEAIGAWRKKVVFVAENGDQNIHQRDAERLATLVDTTYSSFNTNKIYVDAYPIEVNPGSNKAPLVNDAIYSAINQGTLIINYTGHGNEIQWAKTRVFDKAVVDSLKNDFYLPLFVTATCEFGRHDDTGIRSGGEDLLVKNETGAIAAITTARPVFASSNYQLNFAFYNQVFEQVNGEYQRLGDIFKNTKNNSLNGVLNRNFSLLGDPSMMLSYAGKSITIDSLNNTQLSGTDTLSALSELNFIGYIRNSDGSVDQSFNGELEVGFLDKVNQRLTLGNLGGTPFKYNIRDNFLYRGKITIASGRFEFTTVLPKDISYNPKPGKIALYAQKTDSTQDGSGANIEVLIGRSAANPIIDTTPPTITLFLGDTTYRSGGVINPNTLLIAKLFDQYGINTSSNQVGHSITYSLDGAEPINVTAFYSSVKDDYTTGWIYYDLPELTPGNHIITFTAWDTSNNSSETEINFFVSENGEVIISDLSNYPNPMQESTTFTFSHNLGGEEIEATLEIINTSGQVVYRQTRSYISAPSVINDWGWDGRNASGGKMNSGIYIYGINLRSKNSNLTQNQFSRLFVTN